MEEFVKKGHFLDFEDIPAIYRPETVKEVRFGFVEAQNPTSIEGVTVSLGANGTATLDFGKSPVRDLLRPQDDMTFQCCYGFYPDEKSYLVHPTDYEVDKLPEELPSENWRVGVIRGMESPYHQPSTKTEFWTFPRKGGYTPKLQFKEIYGKSTTVYVKVLVNILKVSAIEDKELIEMLEKRKKPVTPVPFKGVM